MKRLATLWRGVFPGSRLHMVLTTKLKQQSSENTCITLIVFFSFLFIVFLLVAVLFACTPILRDE